MADIDHVLGFGCRDLGLETGDPAILDAQIADPIHAVGRVDDVATLEQEFEFVGHSLYP